MASERAKELAAKQKAEAKAAKLAKKNSTDPADWGMIRQIIETYKMTARVDKRLTPYMGLTSGVIVLVSVIVGIVTGHPVWGVMFGLMLSFSACTFLLTERAKRASYKRYEGETGGSQVALMMLDKKKWSYTPAIAFDRYGTVVHRAVGPAGLILIGEGEPNRVKHLLSIEKKRHETVAYGVNVETRVVGKSEGQVPIDQLTKQINKMPKTLETPQIAEVESRLKALDSSRGRVPIPKGPMPTRGSRKAMRG